jgi:hypothetical protein
MKIKSYILVFLLFKILLTVKSDSCIKNEPVTIKEEMTVTVQNESYIEEASVSLYDLDPFTVLSGNFLKPQITDKSDI